MPNEVEREPAPTDNSAAQETQVAESQADFGAVFSGPSGSAADRQERDRQEGKSNTLSESSTDKSSSGETEARANGLEHQGDADPTEGSVADKGKASGDKENAGDKTEAKSDKSEKASFGNPLSLLGSFSDTVAKSVKEAAKSAQDYLPQLELFSGAAKPDASAAKAAGETIKAAEFGEKKTQDQLDQYFGFRDGKAQKGERQEKGDYKNEDGSSYHVDERGDVTQFTTAATADNPQGKTFKASYNENHELVKLETPTGKSFTRSSKENDQGFAYWQARDASGNKTAFGTSTSEPFVGKLELGSEGAKFMLGHDKRHPSQNTKWAGSMIQYGGDGSETRSSLASEKGKTTGFDTTVTAPDGTKTKVHSKLDAEGKASKDGTTEVTSKDGDTKSVVKDGEVVSKEENLKAKERMAEIAHNLDNQDRLQNLKHAKITQRGDKTHFSIDNYGSRDQRNVRSGVVLGDGTRPSHTHVDKHLEFDMQHHKDGTVSMTSIEGMTGYGSKLGPLGRRWHSGSSSVREIHMDPGKDGHGDIHTRTDRGWSTAPSHVLTSEAQKGVDATISKGGDMLDMLHSHTKDAKIDHPTKRSFTIDVAPKDSLKQEAKESPIPITLGDRVAGKFSYDENGMKFSDMKGVSALGHEVTGLKVEPGKGGDMQLSAQYKDAKGEEKSIQIPMSQAKPLLAMFGQEALASKKRK